MNNSSMIPFGEINGQKLSAEQKAYLEGLFQGLKNRGVGFADVQPNPVSAPVPAAKAAEQENQTAEERIKRELFPLDAYPMLLEHAAQNKAPDKENLFRFKWHGLFYLAPNKEGFMARLRIPGGVLKTYQLREIANVARELTTGYVQITTRSNFQIRLIAPKDAPAVLSRIQAVGLHTRGAGADNIRNLTINPTAGIDPHELIDVWPICQGMGQIILNNRDFYNLPRKFNIAFDGGGLIGAVEDTNDIGVKAVRIKEGQAVAAGVYFRIKLGGATGHKTFATDLGVLVSPDHILRVVSALVQVFLENGDRTNRKKARLKHLLESWTLPQYLEATEKQLGFKLIRAALDDSGKCPMEEPENLPQIAHSHVGVFPQKQPGLNYVGVSIPVGQITPKQMHRLADLADHYGSGEVRLTVWQNLMIPNVPDAFVETLKKAVVKMGFNWKQSNLRSGFIACTGNSYCKFASANTKKHAMELVDYLEKRVELDQPINVHLTGCPNSCAQHYMGDIGLLGTSVKVSGETLEGYHVFVGGGFGENQAIGRQLFQGVSFEQLKPTLEKVLKGYLGRRQPGESFQKFTQRHDLNALQVIFTETD
ncbi:MAG: NirA family protein [Verrucomicrobiales bacterium]